MTMAKLPPNTAELDFSLLLPHSGFVILIKCCSGKDTDHNLPGFQAYAALTLSSGSCQKFQVVVEQQPDKHLSKRFTLSGGIHDLR